MTLYDFVNETRCSITMFMAEWIESNEKNPRDYPIKMNEADWDEQFHLICMSKAKQNNDKP